MSDPSSLPPPSGSAAGRVPPLDGEVIPPVLRVVNPTPRDDAAPVAPRPSLRLRLGVAALALAALAGGAGAVGALGWSRHAATAAGQPDQAALALARLSRDVADLRTSVEQGRRDESVKALQKGVEQLKADLQGLRSSNAAAVAQIGTRLDKAAAADASSPTLAEVAARLDKLDRDGRLGEIASRLDRIERQVSSPTPTGSIAAPPRAPAAQTIVAQAGAAPKPARPTVLDNWIVRDVYSGIALVEGRTGSVREVVPGEVLPGAGEVRSIERHGRGWIVVTSRGIIDTETW